MIFIFIKVNEYLPRDTINKNNTSPLSLSIYTEVMMKFPNQVRTLKKARQ